MTHCYASRGASGSAADANDFVDAMWEEPACGEALHCTHGRANACVETIDVEGIEESELSLDHVEYGEDREACSEALTCCRIDGGRAG